MSYWEIACGWPLIAPDVPGLAYTRPAFAKPGLLKPCGELIGNGEHEKFGAPG